MSDGLNAVLDYQPRVKAALEACIRRHQQSSGGTSAWQKDVMERLLTFATTGKLLRGCLVCYSYGLEGKAAPTEAVLNAAVSLELMHTALLIHDDIIDRDDTRRGGAALHSQYRQLAERQQLEDPARFGDNMALCAGDMAVFLAVGLINAVPASPAIDAALGDLFSRALTTVCAGQMADIHQGLSSAGPTKQAIYSIMRCKTATYSVALPLAAGAVLAGQPVRVQQRLYELGVAAGIIFQIRDDELGMFGQADELGKPVGSDIREGKKTLLYYYLWQAASASEKRYLKTVFGNAGASPADVITVQKLLRRHGVPARLKQDINRLEQTADRHINQLALSQKAQDKLHRIVTFCAARQV